MNIQVVGLVVALGVSLSGCSGETATDDLRNCRDAHNARELYALETMSAPVDQLSDLNISLSQKLADISSRATSQALSDALSSDANDLDVPDYDQFFGIERFQFNSVCMAEYGITFMAPE